MAKQELKHLAYLVKLWQVHSEGKKVWRASLEDAHTGEKRGFGDPAVLFALLQEKIGLGLSQARNDETSQPNPADGSK